MTISNEHISILPQASVTWYFIVVTPTGKTLPEAGPSICSMVKPSNPQVVFAVGSSKVIMVPFSPGCNISAISF